MNKIGVFLTLLLIQLIFFYSHALASTTLNLHSALQYATSHSPSLQAAQYRMEQAHLEKQNTLSRFFPTLDLSSSLGVQGNSPASDTALKINGVTSTYSGPWSSQSSLTLNETLYDNGESWTNHQIASLKKEQAQAVYRRERDQILRDVAIAFYQFSSAAKVAELLSDQEKIVVKQFEQVSRNYEQGLKTRKDYLRFKAQVSRAAIDLANAQLAVEKTTSNLKQILGVPHPDIHSLHFQADYTPFDSSNSILIPNKKETLDLESHIDFQINQLQEKMNALEVEKIRRNYWPSLSLAASANYLNSSYLATGASWGDNANWSWSAGITLKANLWDWGIRKRDLAIAEQSEAIKAAEISNEMLKIRKEIGNILIDLSQTRSVYQLTRELLELEQGNFDFIDEEYRKGKVNFWDMVNAMKDLSDAKTKYWNALFALKQGLVSYYYHKGTLHEILFNH